MLHCLFFINEVLHCLLLSSAATATRLRSRALKLGLIRFFFSSGTVFSSDRFLQNSSKFLQNCTIRTGQSKKRGTKGVLLYYGHRSLYIFLFLFGILLVDTHNGKICIHDVKRIWCGSKDTTLIGLNVISELCE